MNAATPPARNADGNKYRFLTYHLRFSMFRFSFLFYDDEVFLALDRKRYDDLILITNSELPQQLSSIFEECLLYQLDTLVFCEMDLHCLSVSAAGAAQVFD